MWITDERSRYFLKGIIVTDRQISLVKEYLGIKGNVVCGLGGEK